jgi:hypothetical protein
MDKVTITRGDIDPKPMVYCHPMRTYVPLAFCLNGGPMDADGKCEWLVEIKKTTIVHSIPQEVNIENHVSMKKEP